MNGFSRLLFAGALVSLAAGHGIHAAGEETVTPRSDPPKRFMGKPPIGPRWAFEPWVWEDNGNTQDSTLGLVDGYRQRGIPVGVVIVDSPWETAYHSFDWDKNRYRSPKRMFAKLHDDNVRVVRWITGAQNTAGKDIRDPGVMIQRIVIDWGGLNEMYVGPSALLAPSSPLQSPAFDIQGKVFQSPHSAICDLQTKRSEKTLRLQTTSLSQLTSHETECIRIFLAVL